MLLEIRRVVNAPAHKTSGATSEGFKPNNVAPLF
jgi:hypothetical protein